MKKKVVDIMENITGDQLIKLIKKYKLEKQELIFSIEVADGNTQDLNGTISEKISFSNSGLIKVIYNDVEECE